MTVYLLVATYYLSNWFAPPQMRVETMIFQDAARCLRNLEANKKDLSARYYDVQLVCLPKELIK